MVRSRIDIITDILETSSKEWLIKGDIMRHANLDSDQFNSYSDFLQKRRLLEKRCDDNTTYKTTQRGKRFLKYANYIRMLLTPEK